MALGIAKPTAPAPAAAVIVIVAANQYTAAGAASFCYDRNGNLVADSGNVYIYDIENRLVERRVRTAGESSCAALTYSGAQLAQLRYDPAGRLYELVGTVTGTTRFLNDGDAMVGEYAAAGTLLRRYVHGSDLKADDPLVWYEGAGTADRRWLHADERGSIVTVSDASGTATAINIYDEYGVPGTANQWRFTYTGQAWLHDLGMYYYKARIYSPTLGRFMQTDPIGYEDQVNLYAYVANDPVNSVDPTGLEDKSLKDRVYGAVKRAVDAGRRALDAGGRALDAGSRALDKGAAAVRTAGAAAERVYNLVTDNSARPSGLGDLTKGEVAQIQTAVNQAGRPLDVVGSAATGDRRGVGTDLPIGKGLGTRSDIDYTVAPSSVEYFGDASLPSLDKHGILAGTPEKGTASIRFEPENDPKRVEN